MQRTRIVFGHFSTYHNELGLFVHLPTSGAIGAAFDMFADLPPLIDTGPGEGTVGLTTKKNLFNFPPAMQITAKCPICGTEEASFNSAVDIAGNLVWNGWCRACTNVAIEHDALDTVKRLQKEHLLSAYLNRLPVDDFRKLGNVTPQNVEELVSSVSELTILEQFDEALRLICTHCPSPGRPTLFDPSTDWPRLTAQSSPGAFYIVKELAQMGYLHSDNASTPRLPTWKGYERLQHLQSSGRGSNVGFVAMSFSKEQEPVWKKVIEPGILMAGYKPLRLDKHQHNNRVDDEIVAQIRGCRFVVADFTEQNEGAYFEAGFALGLGRDVVWMCNKAEEEHLHFDTRQFNHIFYENHGKALTDLVNRIVAHHGRGSHVRLNDEGK